MKPDLIAGVFDSGAALARCARAAREKGLKVHDAYTPYPVHGLDEALGLSRSRLPAACLALGLTGLLLAFGFQEWVFLVDWPMNIGGKPDNAWPAYLPVTFELTVLFAGVGTVLVFLFWRGLNPWREPRMAGLGATDDKFVLALEPAPASQEGKEALREFLKRQGARDVREDRP